MTAPYAVNGRIPFDRLTERQRYLLEVWCRDRVIDPARVDTGSLIERDGDEWRIGLRRPDGTGYTLVRRAHRAPRPVSIIDLSPYLATPEDVAVYWSPRVSRTPTMRELGYRPFNGLARAATDV